MVMVIQEKPIAMDFPSGEEKHTCWHGRRRLRVTWSEILCILLPALGCQTHMTLLFPDLFHVVHMLS